MITLDDLCTDMARSGRHLTPRGARDWWTKGLLPRPQQKGLGRGKGKTPAFWTQPNIQEQARAVYDSLSKHSRTNTALLSLWLSGFPIDLKHIRTIYKDRIEQSFVSIRSSDEEPEDSIGKFAARVARKFARSSKAPAGVQDTLTDLTIIFINTLYSIDDDFFCHDLVCEMAQDIQCLFKAHTASEWSKEFQITNAHIARAMKYFKDHISRGAQQGAISYSSDYEMDRARRLVRFVFGHAGRSARATQSDLNLEDYCRPLLIVLGGPAVPILIMVLRDRAVRRDVTKWLLNIAVLLRGLSSAPLSDPGIHRNLKHS